MIKFQSIEDCIDHLAHQLEPILDPEFNARRYADGIYSEWDNGLDGGTYYVRASHCKAGVEREVNVPSIAKLSTDKA
jgi:hypothetical protein